MKRLLLCAVALVVAFGASANEPQTNEVVVNGYAERVVTPNKFMLAITINESDSKGRMSLDEQERAMTKALKSAGFDTDEALRLKNNYSAYNRRGAYATRFYELVVFGAEDLACAFETLESLNLHSVSLKSATCTDIDTIREELRREAIRDAKRNAEVLAEAIDQSIGRCTYIHDYNSNGDVVFNTNSAMKFRGVASIDYDAVAEEAAAEPLEFAGSKISHTIQAKFELK
ncbi:MAG: SIMPL domain-containing protein [Alistipes sp.]|nr:SIMPL domain-containing protein [Alistipes sp.]